MPMSFSNEALGYATYGIIKLVGYTLVSRRIGQDDPESSVPSLLVGATRTILGMLIGAICHQCGLGSQGLIVLWLVLFPIRMLEWGVVIRLFYARQAIGPSRGMWAALFGTAWSYILDIPATLGFLLTGGLSIC